MSHEDLEDFLFFKQRKVSINEEVDEEGGFETTLQVEEVVAPSIINTDQDTEIASLLEGNI